MILKGSQVNAGKDKRWSSGSRPDNKIAVLTGQGVSESNVLEYLGCIEQRAVSREERKKKRREKEEKRS